MNACITTLNIWAQRCRSSVRALFQQLPSFERSYFLGHLHCAVFSPASLWGWLQFVDHWVISILQIGVKAAETCQHQTWSQLQGLVWSVGHLVYVCCEVIKLQLQPCMWAQELRWGIWQVIVKIQAFLSVVQQTVRYVFYFTVLLLCRTYEGTTCQNSKPLICLRLVYAPYVIIMDNQSFFYFAWMYRIWCIAFLWMVQLPIVVVEGKLPGLQVKLHN
jgi:hypothetical protein